MLLTRQKNSAESEAFTIKAVDLGLPSGLKWANANVGATSVTDAGLYFMWGETEGHAIDSGYEFTEENYNAKGLDVLSKNLDLDHDAARANMGGTWRMPTKAEIDELIANTTRTWTTNYEGTGKEGYVITSKTNSNSIFMPAAGYCEGSSLFDFGSGGDYWSSSSTSFDRVRMAYFLCFNPATCSTGCNSNRWCGRSVRGVCE